MLVTAPTLLVDAMTPLELALHFAGGLGVAGFFIWTAWPRDHAAGIALRKKLLAARLYFEAQLQREKPELDDRWCPYLLALDLSAALDAWSLSFDQRPEEEPEREPSSEASEPTRPQREGGSQTEAPERRGWTGGGGSFGGGGASLSWSSAVGELASGVSSPASSTDEPTSGASESSDPGPGSSEESSARSGGGSAGGW